MLINLPIFAMIKKSLLSVTFCAFVSVASATGLSVAALPVGNAFDGCFDRNQNPILIAPLYLATSIEISLRRTMAFTMPTHPPQTNVAFTMPTHPPQTSVAFTMPTHPPQTNVAFTMPTHPPDGSSVA
jgi:hypothetical protein